ncbi:damage-inducible protein DinB [Bacillus sp. AFS015802]|uniref:DinB family protein n=1 Tax=Bacillus sp. AFS015802 TaxID=2033486 RepID=UPI000BF8C2C6|nr:DinB family protein [Bacillus sp. AFS015802]PFA69185.1 damage-inducible protein DinB [Bacillus sp. AFS015802]
MIIESVFQQIEVAINTLLKIMDQLTEEDLNKRPTPNKHSIGELLEHIAVLFEADWRISNGASGEDMKRFYSGVSYPTLNSVKEGLNANYHALKNNYSKLSEDQLMSETTSYWGVTYTRYEWLLEILAHIYHHRGQLHAMLVHCLDQDPDILMFE